MTTEPSVSVDDVFIAQCEADYTLAEITAIAHVAPNKSSPPTHVLAVVELLHHLGLTSWSGSRDFGHTRSSGGIDPVARADLVIPSLKLIIEAKFARATDSLKEIQRQLAQDAAMYFPQGVQYDRMIAFVWDDSARTEEHATLIQGLEKLERVAGVIVVNRPSKMHAPPVAPASPADRGGAS